MNLSNAASLCGGVTIVPSQTFFTADGLPVIRSGDQVLPHGQHIGAQVVSTRFFTCNGIPVTTVTDQATCLDLVATGVGFIEISE